MTGVLVTIAIAGLAVRPQPTAPAPGRADAPAAAPGGQTAPVPQWSALSPRCAAASSPIAELVAAHAWFTDLDVAQVQRLVDIRGELHQGCGPGEIDTLSAQLDAWIGARPPTAPAPVVLSSSCATALEPVRAQLRALPQGPAAARQLPAVADEAVARGGAACTTAEQLLFTAAEITWPMSVAGLLPSGATDGAPPAGGGEAPPPFTEHVAAPRDRAQVSEACATALVPARTRLHDAVGRSFLADDHDALSRELAAAVTSCTTGELDSFQALEVAPALGLDVVTSAPGT